MRETWVRSLGQEVPLGKEMATHSCLQNPMDGGAWQATVHGATKSPTQLSNFAFFFLFLQCFLCVIICLDWVRFHLLY